MRHDATEAPVSPAENNAQQTVPTNRVEIRMYCMGTGDCFVLKFLAGKQPQFTMLIDCGSCVGKRPNFLPYIQDLVGYVEGKLDLLVVTHEHLDHVNGFDKCLAEFETLTIGEAWFAWTEDPDDAGGLAQDLLKKRQKMRLGLRKAISKMHANRTEIEAEQQNLKANQQALLSLDAFLDGMDTLGNINLDEDAPRDESLAGMRKIKQLLKAKQVRTRYLTPGSSLTMPLLPGVRFHVLGPPLDKAHIFANGKEGRDTYKRHEVMGEGLLAMNSFVNLGEESTNAELPFAAKFAVPQGGHLEQHSAGATDETAAYLKQVTALIDSYSSPDNKWRNIENEWLYSAGSLAIRLDSHINNTSLALAVEIGTGGPVLLLPGDAEYANWESWHLIDKWKGIGPKGKHFVEDLLNRTVFYKVAHHLSFNGTPLDKGIRLLNNPDLAVMVTLDRSRISSRWKTTMPNKRLLQDLMERSQGKCILMDEIEIVPSPSTQFDLLTLGEERYKVISKDDQILAKQYTVIIT
jgi:hypothetical protein